MPTTATTIVSEMTEATEQLMSIVSMLRSRDTLADAIVDVDIAAELRRQSQRLYEVANVAGSVAATAAELIRQFDYATDPAQVESWMLS